TDLLGELATEGKPGVRIPFAVERINPVAEVVEDKNVFKVRVRLLERPYQMVPGMEGVAKIRIGRRTYAYLWTRKLVNWVRMKLWI
ncbi:MAG: HlyD family efflux transporter periplasmic adaptor subunit, partial [Planctomycetota bacterium]